MVTIKEHRLQIISKVMASSDCISEIESSVCDDERIRKLFQACDTDGDGFIDSHDLFSVCKELSLEDSINELMEQLGADAQGRISYEQFLQSRLALRPEIEALKNSKQDVASDNSQGKLDQWEWDSGARDMSPIPKSHVQRQIQSGVFTEEDFKQRLQKSLDEQAQRYEERLTELHSVIAELTKKLHQQHTMVITEEDEASEICTSACEDSGTCPLDINEVDTLENTAGSDSRLQIPDNIEFMTQNGNQTYKRITEYSNLIESLKTEVMNLKTQLLEAQTTLTRFTLEENKRKMLNKSHDNANDTESNINLEEKAFVPVTNVPPIVPLTKIAERVKLKRTADTPHETNPNYLINSDLPTIVLEHMVGDMLCQCCNAEKEVSDIEMRRVIAKLEHVKSQNQLLEITLKETKASCDRLALLCGKYESNAVALHLALSITDRTIEAYDVLLALLETEIVLDKDMPETVENRVAAETIAMRLLTHLDNCNSTDALCSSWQCDINERKGKDVWTSEHEHRLREHVSCLKAERTNIQGTCVTLESVQFEPVSFPSSQENKKMDLEMAVLMQELMSLREDKAELSTKLFNLEKEKNAIELRLKSIDEQYRVQTIALKNIQDQLKNPKTLLALTSK